MLPSIISPSISLKNPLRKLEPSIIYRRNLSTRTNKQIIHLKRIVQLISTLWIKPSKSFNKVKSSTSRTTPCTIPNNQKAKSHRKHKIKPKLISFPKERGFNKLLLPSRSTPKPPSRILMKCKRDFNQLKRPKSLLGEIPILKKQKLSPDSHL